MIKNFFLEKVGGRLKNPCGYSHQIYRECADLGRLRRLSSISVKIHLLCFGEFQSASEASKQVEALGGYDSTNAVLNA